VEEKERVAARKERHATASRGLLAAHSPSPSPSRSSRQISSHSHNPSQAKAVRIAEEEAAVRLKVEEEASAAVETAAQLKAEGEAAGRALAQRLQREVEEALLAHEEAEHATALRATLAARRKRRRTAPAGGHCGQESEAAAHCTICLEQVGPHHSTTAAMGRVSNDDACCTTQCGHTYHRECLMKWLDVGSSCPTCKRHVSRRRL
jgi:hypothetical protein